MNVYTVEFKRGGRYTLHSVFASKKAAEDWLAEFYHPYPTVTKVKITKQKLRGFVSL